MKKTKHVTYLHLSNAKSAYLFAITDMIIIEKNHSYCIEDLKNDLYFNVVGILENKYYTDKTVIHSHGRDYTFPQFTKFSEKRN